MTTPTTGSEPAPTEGWTEKTSAPTEGFDYPAPSHIAPGQAGTLPKFPPKLETPTEPVWGRQEGENDLWYRRFQDYCLLGPTRSISLAATGRRNAYPLPSHWSIIGKDYRWRERANAYDSAVATGSIDPFPPAPEAPTITASA